jgi:hypothetical protein
VGVWLKDGGRGPQKTIAKIAEIAKIAKILKVQNLTADQRGLTRIRQIKRAFTVARKPLPWPCEVN